VFSLSIIFINIYIIYYIILNHNVFLFLRVAYAE